MSPNNSNAHCLWHRCSTGVVKDIISRCIIYLSSYLIYNITVNTMTEKITNSKCLRTNCYIVLCFKMFKNELLYNDIH